LLWEVGVTTPESATRPAEPAGDPLGAPTPFHPSPAGQPGRSRRLGIAAVATAAVTVGGVLAWPHVVPSSWPGAAAPDRCGTAPQPSQGTIIQLHLTGPTSAAAGTTIVTTLTATAGQDVTAAGGPIEIVISRNGAIVGRAPTYTGPRILSEPVEPLTKGRPTPIDFSADARQATGHYNVLIAGCPKQQSAADPTQLARINHARSPLASGSYQIQAIAAIGTAAPVRHGIAGPSVTPPQPSTLISPPITIQIHH
jgi:hypothetical protein